MKSAGHNHPQELSEESVLRSARRALLEARVLLLVWLLRRWKPIKRMHPQVRLPTDKERIDASLREFLSESDTEQELPIANDNALDEDDIPTVRIIYCRK